MTITALAAFAGAALSAWSPQAPPLKTTTVRLDAAVVVSVRHVDADSVDAAGDDPPAVRLRVTVGGRTVHDRPLRGREGWAPWGLQRVRATDVDGDGRRDAVVTAFSHHGGSGSVLCLALVRRTATGAVVIEAPSTTAENIHTGAFYAARLAGGGAGLVITEPLMDNETRPEPTHWRVRCLRLTATGLKAVSTRTTARRHAEKVPASAVRAALPAGWTLGARLD